MDSKFYKVNLSILSLSIIFIIFSYLFQGSSILGIWESLNYFNIFAPKENFFNLEVSPRANLGDVGQAFMDSSRLLIEFFNLKINLFNFRIINIFFSYLTILFFFIISQRYFDVFSAFLVSILLILNPVFNHFQNSMTILFPSIFAFTFMIERLQSIKFYGVNKKSYFLIIPFYILFLHYAVTKAIGLAIFIYYICQIYFKFNNKKKFANFVNFLFFIFFVFLITFFLLSISSYTNTLYTFHPLKLFFGFGTGETLLTEQSNNSINFLKNISINLNIIFDSLLNLNTYKFTSDNANFISADFRFNLINIIFFLIFLIGLIFLISKLVNTKNKFKSIYFDILFLFFICFIPQLFSSVYYYNSANINILSTLSTQRLFILIIPIYLIICLCINQIFFKIKNNNIKILISFLLIIYSIFIVYNSNTEFNSDIKYHNKNLAIDKSNIYWSKKTKGNFDRDSHQHLELHSKYKHISSKLCEVYNSNKANYLFNVNLQNFKNNYHHPPDLPYLNGFNFHLIFLSFYLSDCGVSNAWLQVLDNKFSLRKVGFTEFRNYSAKLLNDFNYDQNYSYLNIIRDYNMGNNFNFIITNDYELDYAEKYFKDNNLNYIYFEYN